MIPPCPRYPVGGILNRFNIDSPEETSALVSKSRSFGPLELAAGLKGARIQSRAVNLRLIGAFSCDGAYFPAHASPSVLGPASINFSTVQSEVRIAAIFLLASQDT